MCVFSDENTGTMDTVTHDSYQQSQSVGAEEFTLTTCDWTIEHVVTRNAHMRECVRRMTLVDSHGHRRTDGHGRHRIESVIGCK
jgi:hypothetical protein